ncbi:MAG: hypothetical protein ACM3QS_16950 [Bacteroidota bacterium]
MAHWFFDTAGIGSLVVFIVGISILVAYIRMLNWIHRAPREGAGRDPGTEK